MNKSIIIPTYNEERTIGKCLLSILKQISSEDEIIVVSSDCHDGTEQQVRMIQKFAPNVMLIIEKERNGKASALNLGIKNAKNDIIIQSDGDCEVCDEAISKLAQHFDNPKVGGISGCPVPILPKDNLFHDWTVMSYNKMDNLRKKESKLGTFWHMSGYLLAFRKQALPSVPFAKGAVDAWMGKIIKENGYLIEYEPAAKVFVRAPTTIQDFVRQKARVRAGFVALPNAPRSPKTELLWLPKEIIKIPITRLPKFLFSGCVYAYAWLKGFYLAKTNASLAKIWKTPESTK